MGRQSYITLATDEAYCIGALVLATSLRQTQTAKELSIIVTGKTPQIFRPLLEQYFDNVIEVEELHTRITTIAPLRSELTVTLTKVQCWTLTQFSKMVYMDADTVVLHNIDELFERSELSAAPEPCWPDCFNSGVFVLEPNMDTYTALLKVASEKGSFDGGDQGLLNTYFSDWATKTIERRLSYVYNCICTITDECALDFYTSLPAWVQFGGAIRVAHFSGPIKPWHRMSAAKGCSEAALTALVGTRSDRRAISRNSGMLAFWWSLFLVLVKPRLSPDMPGVAGNLAAMEINKPDRLCAHHERIDTERMYAWERGQIDYTGVDRFANILAKIYDTMSRHGGAKNNLPVGMDIPS